MMDADYKPGDMKLLLVDDTVANIDVLNGTLAPCGYNIAVANSGEKALKVVERFKPDLILLDVMMPGIDGFQTCRRLKENPQTAGIPVIFITAKVEASDVDEGFRMGAVDYVTKPFRSEEVQARVRTHLLLQHALKRMRQLNAQKDKLLGTVAHDLRNPIGGVLGYAEIIRDDGDGMPLDERGELLEQIAEVCRGMLAMVNDLLDAAAIQRGVLNLNIGATKLSSIVAQRAALSRFAAEKKGIKIELGESPTVMVQADERRIAQVMDNLLTNAVKFSPAGSVVRVELEKKDEKAYVRVVDQGPGLTEEDVKKLFQDFTPLSARPTANETSTGLGLAIAKKVVDAHGGEMFAGNGTQGGAVFGFALPA